MPILLCILFMAPGAWAHRWIATSPETTEILFQIGGGNFVVGALEGSQYPPEAARLPTIGSLFNPSLEKTLELKPSLVVLDTHNINPSFATSLKALHVPTFTWDTSSPTSLLSEVRRFVAEQKISLSPQVALWEECVQSARTQPPTSALRYLAFVWMEPPIVLGSRAFLSQLLSLLGYENVVGVNLQSPYLPVTQEWILSQTMDRILYLKYRSDPEALFQTHFSRWWPVGQTKALKLDADWFARASFTAFEALSRIELPRPLPESCRAF